MVARENPGGGSLTPPPLYKITGAKSPLFRRMIVVGGLHRHWIRNRFGPPGPLSWNLRETKPQLFSDW